jgi:hypothetical protein
MKKYTHIPQIMIDLIENSDVRLKSPIDIDDIFEVGNEILSKGKDESEFTESEHTWFGLLNSLMLYSLNYQMKNDSKSLESMYQLFKSGEHHELSDNESDKNIFEKMVIDNLIESEQYEKVVELKKNKKK